MKLGRWWGNPNASTKPLPLLLKALWCAYQFQHPWAATTSGKAAEKPEDNDCGTRSNEHVGGIGRVFSNERDVCAKGELAPDAYCKKDNSCDLQSKRRKLSGATREGIQIQYTVILKRFIGALVLAEESLETFTNSRGMEN